MYYIKARICPRMRVLVPLNICLCYLVPQLYGTYFLLYSNVLALSLVP